MACGITLHGLRRRFSLEPSSQKEGGKDGPTKNGRNEISHKLDNEQKPKRYKVTVMGASQVGKSSIITKFLYDINPKKSPDRMYDFELSPNCIFDILDMSDWYEFPAMTTHTINHSDFFILVYDVHDQTTFEELRVFRSRIIKEKGKNVPIVFVGNKIDLVEKEKEVETDVTKNLVTEKWGHGFVETSAKDDIDIDKVFKEVAAQAGLLFEDNSIHVAMQRHRRKSLPPKHLQNLRSSSTGHEPTSTQLKRLEKIYKKDSKEKSEKNFERRISSCSLS